MRASTRLVLGLVALVALGGGTPPVASAQSVVHKVKRAAKQKVAHQRERTEQAIVDDAVEPLDSTLTRADSALTRAAREVMATLRGEPREVRRLARALRRGRAVLDDVTFLDAGEQLDSASAKQLVALAQAMATVEGAFVIAAHTERLGTGLEPASLSARRAAIVRAWLVAAGVPEERLFTQGHAAVRPTARIEVRRLQ
ncbi:MAG TPA: OmpA family protein [Gemmatimonadaceae bacterium]|nr:OmpA family protein [Gemmatimonadaceae bacterium]